METITKILEKFGHESAAELEAGTEYQIPGGQAFMDLTIKKLDDEFLIVAHYHESQGTQLADPKIGFNVAGDEWVPYLYVQDPWMRQHDPTGLDLNGFPSQWSENLRHQGFISRAEDLAQSS